MARPDKVAAVAELKEKFSSAGATVLTEYRGLTVKQLQDLRRALGENAHYAVVKNTLTQIAAKDAGVEGLDDLQVLPARHGEQGVLRAEAGVDTALDPLDAQRLGDAGDRGVQALGAGGVGHVVHATGVHCAVPLRSRAAPGVDLVRVGGASSP